MLQVSYHIGRLISVTDYPFSTSVTIVATIVNVDFRHRHNYTMYNTNK